MLRILIVDDDRIIRELLRSLFEESGYEIIEAVNGNEAIKVFNSRQVDMVITDINMPQKNGLELIAELKYIDPDVKIIAVSSDCTESASRGLRVASRLGASLIFSKPFDFKHLLKAVKELLKDKFRE